MRKIITLAVLILALIIPALPAASAGKQLTYIEIILDCSDSMKREVGKAAKIDTAKAALIDFINTSPEEYRFALRIMGGDPSATSYTSNLLAGMGLMSKFTLIDMIQKLEAGGERALYNALSECIYDFYDEDGNNIAIVITDGLDDGGQSLGDLVNIYTFSTGAPKLYIYGIDVTNAMVQEFNVLVRAAGGTVTSLPDPSGLKDALKKAGTEMSGNMSVFLYDEYGVPVNGQITVYDAAGNPVEAAYDAPSLIKDLPEGSYTVEGKYRNEVKREISVEVGHGAGRTIKFIFAQHTGNIRLTLVDSMLGAVKGTIKVRDMNFETVYEGGPSSDFQLALPGGTYDIEATAGSQSYTQSGVTITENTFQDIEITIPIIQAILEVEVNNLQSAPINAHISVYTPDGFLMGEVQYASYYQVTVPPGTYNVTVEASDKRDEKSITLADGDQQTLGFDVDIETGFLIIELRTDSGRDAWGLVKVYDARGEYQRHWSIETEESPDWSLELPEGIYRVEAEVEGVISSREGVIVQGNQETRVTLRFPDYLG